MEEWKEFSAKTADEALTNALIQMETTSDQIEYEAIEQPELHLHPALQAKLIDVFSQLASKENGGKIKFVLETHSEAMINRLGYLINKKKSARTG